MKPAPVDATPTEVTPVHVVHANVAAPGQRTHVATCPPIDLTSLFDVRKQPGYYSADRKVALLRRAKARPYDQIWIDFSGGETSVQLQVAGQVLVEGAWNWEAQVGGQALQASGVWEESCWYRDADADYLELELKLTAGWRLERQFLLARKDRFLLLADALIGPAAALGDLQSSGAATNGAVGRAVQNGAAKIRAAKNGAATNGSAHGASGRVEIHYRGSLPLATYAGYLPAAETREGWLSTGGKRQATVIAPALAEWRAEFCHAELGSQGGALSLRQAALGTALYAPLFIDLDPARVRRPLTWRKLTVAEHLEIVPRDVAVAYRVQIGREQWLVYRSLAPRGNRTFIGQNYSSEFVCARFLPSGEAKDIVTVE